MGISSRQWLLAIAAAVVAHLLLLAGLWLGDTANDRPAETPRGVMVSLEELDAGPPPAPTTPSQPVEAPEPASAAAPAPAPSAAEVPAVEDSAPTPAPAAEAQPAPVLADAIEPAQSQGPAIAEAAEIAPATAAEPSQAAPVEIGPGDSLESVSPSERVTAHTPELDTPAARTDETPGNGAGGTSDQATDDYIVRLRAWLSRHKQYPQQARNDDIEGTVRLYIVVDQDGQVISHHIERSSGSAVLDAAAEQMLRQAQPLPSMPQRMRRNRLELIVPVVFSLR
ncbi:hypothetical protein SAOR_04210 [Salinisphaera orenii MK-B5]|uniref:TonB C-terminal domain-containing protein n=2 Tax=Salinisphaera orenii TaxID=856731 RepID=A0A423PUL6_9GAMM|nr:MULTISPECIES: energy transducer TonB [Salinisphaera]ROO29283.1 hypothetical protein SAOR_04210 [Salinisphaera orenii MK-B5]ROO31028.1 hypothetical protein SAHL_07040 [Salinisphaera halophila YIM 95161]